MGCGANKTRRGVKGDTDSSFRQMANEGLAGEACPRDIKKDKIGVKIL
jgi:hypothetical protein